MSVSQPKPAAWKALYNLGVRVIFTIIEVLAARELDGWLALGLWFIAAWNVVTICLVLVGLSILATKQVQAA